MSRGGRKQGNAPLIQDGAQAVQRGEHSKKVNEKRTVAKNGLGLLDNFDGAIGGAIGGSGRRRGQRSLRLHCGVLFAPCRCGVNR
jgi:hypothetical protein